MPGKLKNICFCAAWELLLRSLVAYVYRPISDPPVNPWNGPWILHTSELKSLHRTTICFSSPFSRLASARRGWGLCVCMSVITIQRAIHWHINLAPAHRCSCIIGSPFSSYRQAVAFTTSATYQLRRVGKKRHCYAAFTPDPLPRGAVPRVSSFFPCNMPHDRRTNGMSSVGHVVKFAYNAITENRIITSKSNFSVKIRLSLLKWLRHVTCFTFLEQHPYLRNGWSYRAVKFGT